MPKFILDGKEIEFVQGQTIIEAAKKHGIDIPHFCWHPSLTVSGNCRMCLVEVDKLPKLVIACSTIASEGMVVHTHSQKTIEARNAVMPLRPFGMKRSTSSNTHAQAVRIR